MELTIAYLCGILSGLVLAWAYYRNRPAQDDDDEDRLLTRPPKYTYEVRMDGKTLFPGSGQDGDNLADAKSTFKDPRLPKGRLLEFYTRGNHTASRRT